LPGELLTSDVRSHTMTPDQASTDVLVRVGEILRRERERRGWSLEQAATLVEILDRPPARS
jgi:ribosome-binding protein aMBF1 (putative translation factor)